MNPYIEETEYAASNLINLIVSEEKNLNKYRLLLDSQQKTKEYLDYREPPTSLSDSFQRYEEYIKPYAEKVMDLEISLYTKKESIRTLSGALLQIAKQGISQVYGGLGKCPNGRMINNEYIKNIIFQGRNQSMHFEEGNFLPPVVRCFENINLELKNENQAKEIIDLLGWNNYDDYKKDMIELLG